MHPNIDRFSVHAGVPVVWNGRVCWCSRRLSFSSCCFQKGVSVTMFGRESRPTVGAERCIAQYKCCGDERPVRESWLGFLPAPNGKLRKSRFGTWFSAVSRSISASEILEVYLAAAAVMQQQKPVSFVIRYQTHQCRIKMAAVRAEITGIREVSLSFDVSGNDQQNPESPSGLRLG